MLLSRVLIQLLLVGVLGLWAWVSEPTGHVAALVGYCAGVVAVTLWRATERWERDALG